MSPKKRPKIRAVPDVDPAFAPVVAEFLNNRQVTRGMMMSSFGLKVNGKIFAMHGRGQFVVKLPKEPVDELVSSGKGKRFDPGHGRVMKEWIAFTGEKERWVEFAHEAYEFVKKRS